MKIFSFLFIAFLLLQFTTFAQEGWYEQTSGTTERLNSVYFVDNNTGWAAGLGGIFNTIDGGENWNEQYAGECNEVFFINSNTGWVIGGPTGLLKTTNGGMDWIAKPIIEGCSGNIFFINENIGWAIGPYYQFCAPKIQKTTDGGESWIELQEAVGPGLYFIDSNVGWYVDFGDPNFGTPGVIYKTTNGGQTFFPQDSASALWDVCFADYDNGWIASRAGDILRTTNGGDHWEKISLGVGALNSIDFADANIGWAVGENGAILRTTNGGNEWYEQESGVTETIWSVYFIDGLIGWAVGDSGTIIHTINGGVSFVEEEQIEGIPTEYDITQNFPNPFNPSTKIKYAVPQSSTVVIKVFDLLCNEIETLVNEEKQTGTYELTWYAENLPSGVYFYRLQAGSFVKTKKMVLMK